MTETKTTGKEFLFKVLNGLSMGIVVSLIPNALLGELSKALAPTIPLFGVILMITALAVRLLPVAIGIGVSMQFKLTPIQTAAVSIATLVGSGVATAGEKGAFIFRGTGDVINAGVTVAIAVALVMFFGNKLKAYTILVVPAGVICIGGGLGLFTLPYVQKITMAVGAFVLQVTTLQPVLMGGVLAVIFAFLIVSPISTVGIALAISLAGVGSGTANLGITATALTFAVCGMKSNSWGTFVAQLMGPPKMQLANFIKKPVMIVPALCSAAVVGVLGAIFNVQGTPFSAGFGISGFIGPVNALALAEGGWSAGNVITMVMVFIVVPFILAFVFDYLFKKVLKLTTDEDYRLDFS